MKTLSFIVSAFQLTHLLPWSGLEQMTDNKNIYFLYNW